MFPPSGEYATLMTDPVCPVSGLPTAAPVCASQTRMVLSPDPETMFRPSGEYATLMTDKVCPINGSPMVAPVSASQIRIVLSREPETTLLPSGEYETLRTPLVCPFHIFVGAGQYFTRPLHTLRISGNNVRILFHILDSIGRNGRVEMYICAALVEIGVKNESTTRNASSIRS